MTVADTRGTEMTSASLMETAYKAAGIHDAAWSSSDGGYAADADLGLTLLDVLTKEWQTHGLIVRNVEFYDLTLTQGTYKYDMPDYTLDVVNDGMFFDSTVTDPEKATGETLVRQISQDHWHRLSDKESEGRPYQFMVYRTVRPVQVWLHNIPDDTGSTIRFRVQRQMTDSSIADKTLEFDTFWYNAIISELGARLARAKNFPSTRVMDLRGAAKAALDLAVSFANQRGDTQMIVRHPTPWSRRSR